MLKRTPRDDRTLEEAIEHFKNDSNTPEDCRVISKDEVSSCN
jgi:hypothetical protein